MKTEFGKGLIICLVKFAEHYERKMFSIHTLKFYEEYQKSNTPRRAYMLSRSPYNYDKNLVEQLHYLIELERIYKTPQRVISSQCAMFMNAASDHMYDIQVPKGKSWDKIRVRVAKLRHKALQIGHGFVEHIKMWTSKDVLWCFEEARRIAVMIDKKLGLKDAEEGKW